MGASIVEVQQAGYLRLPGGGMALRIQPRAGNKGNINDGSVQLWLDRMAHGIVRAGTHRPGKEFREATLQGRALVQGDSYTVRMFASAEEAAGQDAEDELAPALFLPEGTHAQDEVSLDDGVPPADYLGVEVPIWASAFSIVVTTAAYPPSQGELLAWLRHPLTGAWVRASKFDVECDANISFRPAPDWSPLVTLAESAEFDAPKGAVLGYRTRDWRDVFTLAPLTSVTVGLRVKP